MKKLLKVNEALVSTDLALLLLRVGIGSLMLVHGIPKMQMLISGDIKFPGMFGMSPGFSLALTVFAEVLCSVFIIFGAAIRFAVIPLITTMLVAVFIIHGSDPFAKKEMAVLYLLSYLVLLLAGSGKYSIDQIVQRSSKPVDSEIKKQFSFQV